MDLKRYPVCKILLKTNCPCVCLHLWPEHVRWTKLEGHLDHDLALRHHLDLGTRGNWTVAMDSEHESEDDFNNNDDARSDDGSERGDADDGKGGGGFLSTFFPGSTRTLLTYWKTELVFFFFFISDTTVSATPAGQPDDPITVIEASSSSTGETEPAVRTHQPMVLQPNVLDCRTFDIMPCVSHWLPSSIDKMTISESIISRLDPSLRGLSLLCVS